MTIATDRHTIDAHATDTLGQRCLYLAWLLWIVMAVALGVKTLANPVAHSVYPCFEAAAKCWWQGQDVYEGHCGHDYRYGPVFAAVTGAVVFRPGRAAPRGRLSWADPAGLLPRLLARPDQCAGSQPGRPGRDRDPR
jgi:hypothetical protein